MVEKVNFGKDVYLKNEPCDHIIFTHENVFFPPHDGVEGEVYHCLRGLQ